MKRTLKALLVDFMEAFNFMVGVLLSVLGGTLLGWGLAYGYDLISTMMMLISIFIGHLCLFISSQIHESDEFDLDFYPIAFWSWLFATVVGIILALMQV